METIETDIEGLIILKPTLHYDKRGYFMESFQKHFINEKFPEFNFIQENESSSSFGVLRGLHFQKPPYSQAKIIRVIEGEVLDVAVDLREKSKTYGKYKSIILSAENKKQFFIPRNFAWIDPLKEMNANVIGLQNGTVTYSDISANYGRDVEELFEQHQKEVELAKEYDIELAYQPFGATKAPIEPIIEGGNEDA